MAEPERRRRRVRPPSSAGGAPAALPAGEPPTEPAAPPEPSPRPSEPPARVSAEAGEAPRATFPRRPGLPGDEREAERGLRGLVGSGSSQVSVGAALRARDAARPSDEQVADAEANLPIVRRNWMPREELPRR